jgi:hypothetical protein
MRKPCHKALLKGVISLFLTVLLVFVQSPALLAGQDLAAPAGRTGLKIIVVEGEGAVHNVGQPAPSQLVVEVTDDSDRPVPGAVLGLLLPDSGPGGLFNNGITALSLVTDTSGRAIAAFTPNAVAGSFQIIVTASFEGLSATATVSQSNTAGGVRATPAQTGSGGISSSTIALILAAAAGAVALGVVMGGGEDPGTPENPGNPGNPVDPTQPTIRIGLGGGATVGAPGWQSSVRQTHSLPQWRP